MPIWTQNILLGNRLWSILRPPAFGECPGLLARSQALFCPVCAKTWAILKIDEEPLVWPKPVSCEDCNYPRYWAPVPGSILGEENCGFIDTCLLAALPLDLLKREFRLTLRAILREGESQNASFESSINRST